jgi:prepilin-type N-terminal cleavage/methylation domain-containing protein
MRSLRRSRASSLANRKGFSLVEILLTVVVLGIMTMIALPKVNTFITHMRVKRATALVAADLEQALALAGRQRKPVRIDCTCASQIYTVADRSGGTARLTRALGADPDYRLTTLTFSVTPVDVFPSGVTSANPLTVTVGEGGYTRQITLSSAGQVRILP